MRQTGSRPLACGSLRNVCDNAQDGEVVEYQINMMVTFVLDD
jgi:flavin-binding protein dodecin